MVTVMRVSKEDRVRLGNALAEARQNGIGYNKWFDSLSPEDQKKEDFLDDEFCMNLVKETIEENGGEMPDPDKNPELFFPWKRKKKSNNGKTKP